MFPSVVNVALLSWLRPLMGLAGIGFVALGLATTGGQAASLLMLEQPGCVWCKRFNEEIAPAYPKTEEGKIAPLRRVDITEDWPQDLKDIRPERLTPTFILLENGLEIDRMVGYPGDEFFWGLLNDMLAKLPDTEVAAPSQ